MLVHLTTRIFFEDEEGNRSDAVLSALPEARRQTLLARREDEGSRGDLVVYRFDIRLQGEGETVFFEP